jgi:hypothetical protein
VVNIGIQRKDARAAKAKPGFPRIYGLGQRKVLYASIAEFVVEELLKEHIMMFAESGHCFVDDLRSNAYLDGFVKDLALKLGSPRIDHSEELNDSFEVHVSLEVMTASDITPRGHEASPKRIPFPAL